jgi:50S ribosomal protein L16 3-hydroxylase
MKLNLNNLSPETFLSEYWQKKPLVIRQGFENFEDFLSPDELAGVASDEVVESRLIYKKAGKWQADFGPFESYDHLGESDWSLVIQALNNWVPELDELINSFSFLPRWRFDDVMTSFATPGGGVGPHIDAYDTFICQGSGRRHWRVGNSGPHKEFVAHPALLHAEAFEAMIDVELEPGDILYIPPGFPHEGVALEPSMSFSVGYRASSARDMFSSLADHLVDNELASQQIEDPDRTPCKHTGMIDKEDFSRIKKHLFETLDDTLISQFAGRFLTHSKCELDLPEEDLGFEPDYLLEMLEQQSLIRLGGLRCLYLENSVSQGIFYINGEQVNLPSELASVIPLLCDQQTLNYEALAPWLDTSEFINTLTQWLNNGFWYFEEEEGYEEEE